MKKFFAGAVLSILILLSIAAFYPSSNDFDPSFFKVVNGKISLVAAGAAAPGFAPITWIDIAHSQTNDWTWDSVNHYWNLDGGASFNGSVATYGGTYWFLPNNTSISIKSNGGISFSDTNTPVRHAYVERGAFYGDGVGMTNIPTAAIQPAPDNAYILGMVGGVPAWTLAGTNVTFVMTIITNTQFLTFIQTNNWTSFTATTINATTINVNGKSVLNLSLSTNIPGSAFEFTTRTTPNSQGTNWILDASQGTVFTINLTNDCNIQYVTNTLTGSTGALLSLNLLPNGADRAVTLNTNFNLLDTNGWTMLTTMNPGLWYQKLTNATTANGGRTAWISFANNGTSSYDQTNTKAIARFSP